MPTKISDYIASFFVEAGLSQVFMITGGGAMHLNHSLGTHPELNCIFNHHEQACTMGADSYFRLTRKPGVVNVTTGPGGTNAITGVWGAYTDSIGMIVLSGQVKWATTAQSTELPIRQLGDQEINIVEVVKPFTKYAITVTQPAEIRYHLEKALFLATNGRPGPCWLDIPINIQAASIDPEKLSRFSPSEIPQPWKSTDLETSSRKVLDKLEQSERPVILLGSGIRLSACDGLFLQIAELLQVPIVTAWNSHDLIPDAHPLYAGRPGTVGTRPGNFTVQNADFLLILGSRLNIRQISYEWNSFARGAYIAWVDIDEIELQKPTVRVNLPIHADLADFLPELQKVLGTRSIKSHATWLSWCRERLERYPVLDSESSDSNLVDPYHFVSVLTNALGEDAVIVTGNGTACVVGFQAAKIKRGQRLFTNSGCAAMGYDLPAAIGASLARPGLGIICLAGDGSIMMNLQELQVISHHALPITIFLFSNNGYASIAQTHKNYFNGIEVGSTPDSGVSFPDFQRLCDGFQIKYSCILDKASLEDVISETLSHPGPQLCEVFIDPNQSFSPKLSSRQLPDGSMVSSPLEDMAPFLPRDEFRENMLIPLYNEYRKPPE